MSKHNTKGNKDMKEKPMTCSEAMKVSELKERLEDTASELRGDYVHLTSLYRLEQEAVKAMRGKVNPKDISKVQSSLADIEQAIEEAIDLIETIEECQEGMQ